MPRLSKIEKLARDICWADWRRVVPSGVTKASFWDARSEGQRDAFLAEAMRFQFICQKLKPLRILQMVDIDYPGQTRGKR